MRMPVFTLAAGTFILNIEPTGNETSKKREKKEIMTVLRDEEDGIMRKS
jgi:hypothetical protein